MLGPLDISLKDELLFIESLLIPAFDPDNELDTSKKRKEWLKTRGVQKKWSLDILTELIERYGMVKSLEEAKAEEVKAERLLEKAEENERKQGGAGGSGGHNDSFGETSESKKQKVEVIITEEGKFLDITGVPDLLRLRSGLKKYLYRRDCYEDFIADIIASLPLKHCKTIET